MTATGEITRAEARVMHELMRDGAGNRTIAARLGIAEDTVKAHMKALLSAAGAESRTEFVVAVFRGDVRLRVRRRRPDEPQSKPINHGTFSGFLTHHRRGVEMCEPCAAVSKDHFRRMQAARRSA